MCIFGLPLWTKGLESVRSRNPRIFLYPEMLYFMKIFFHMPRAPPRHPPLYFLIPVCSLWTMLTQYTLSLWIRLLESMMLVAENLSPLKSPALLTRGASGLQTSEPSLYPLLDMIPAQELHTLQPGLATPSFCSPLLVLG